LVSRQPFRFFRPALIFLSYPAKVARATARLLGARRHESGSEGRFRPYTILLNREMNYCYSTSELKWSGKHDSHVLYLLVPGQAPRLLRLLPDKLADGGGLSPQTSYEEVLPVFKTGHRYAVLRHPFEMVIPARIALAASSFAGKRSRSAELRDSLWRR
jgi:hypothetical protein